MYEWVAPSGVKVVSSAPKMEDRWWDNPWLHLFWSYTSWTTMVLADVGLVGPRRWFNKHLQREAWKVTYRRLDAELARLRS